tara:strand:+ start:1274 stop:1522 length:249 start_codon:yes stop_codon:yes gene_type:complete
MELLYYAIISYCLSTCSVAEDFTRYVYTPAVSLEECMQATEEMAKWERKQHNELVHKPINTLCVQTKVMSEERLSLHKEWHP